MLLPFIFSSSKFQVHCRGVQTKDSPDSRVPIQYRLQWFLVEYCKRYSAIFSSGTYRCKYKRLKPQLRQRSIQIRHIRAQTHHSDGLTHAYSRVGWSLVDQLTQQEAPVVKLLAAVVEGFKNKHFFETDHTITPTDDVFAHSGVGMQNPLSWCRVHV